MNEGGGPVIRILSVDLPFMQTILATAPIRFSQWFSALSLALVVLVVMALFKWVKGQREVAV